MIRTAQTPMIAHIYRGKSGGLREVVKVYSNDVAYTSDGSRPRKCLLWTWSRWVVADVTDAPLVGSDAAARAAAERD